MSDDAYGHSPIERGAREVEFHQFVLNEQERRLVDAWELTQERMREELRNRSGRVLVERLGFVPSNDPWRRLVRQHSLPDAPVSDIVANICAAFDIPACLLGLEQQKEGGK